MKKDDAPGSQQAVRSLYSTGLKKDSMCNFLEVKNTMGIFGRLFKNFSKQKMNAFF